MGIFGFLFGLGCLVLIAWAIALLGHAVFSRKHRRQRRSSKRLPNPTEPKQSRETPAPSPPVPQLLPPSRAIALMPPPTSTRVRRKNSKHQLYIRQAAQVLEQLRSGDVRLPKAIGMLRRMNPYAFEELLLTCCHERDWKIKRNFKYSNDGGIDGRVTIAGKLYLIQAKRYCGYISPKHIHDFYQVIQEEEAYGGFFIHSGKTGELANQLLREYGISLLSGQRLVDFVLGQQLKVIG